MAITPTVYGCTSADFTTSRNGRLVPNAPYTAWTAEIGGDPVTGLLTLDGEPLVPQVSDDDGALRFKDPRGGEDPIWIDTGWGRRVAVRPLNLVGQSAYEIAVAEGFVGTEAEWLESLHGAPGTISLNSSGVIVSQAATNGTDQTAVLQAEIDALAAAGGGTLVMPAGLVRCDGQITIPTYVYGTQRRQRPIRILGQAQHRSGEAFSEQTPTPNATGLDLRYAGRTDAGCVTTRGSAVVLNAAAQASDRGLIVTGAGIPDQAYVLSVDPGVSWTLARAARATGTAALNVTGGRIQAFGVGLLEIERMQLVSGTATSSPFVWTTGPTLMIRDCMVSGHTSKTLPDEDIAVIGGRGHGTALTADLEAGVAITSLPVRALPIGTAPSGRKIVLAPGTAQEVTLTLTGTAAKGATSIPVASFTPAQTIPAGSGVALFGSQAQSDAEAWAVPAAPMQGYGTTIQNCQFFRVRRISIGLYASDVRVIGCQWMHNCGSNLAVTPSTLTTGVTAGDSVTTLAVSALAAPVLAGDVVQVGVGPTSQEFVASSDAAPGATSVAVTTATAAFTFAIGAKVFNSTAGLGAAVESWADPLAEANCLTVVENRIGMSGEYSFGVRLSGITAYSQIRGNSLQDAHAANLGHTRCDRNAVQNLIEKAWHGPNSAEVDDWSSANHAAAQTIISPFSTTRLPKGVVTNGDPAVTWLDGSGGLANVTSAGERHRIVYGGGNKRQWNFNSMLSGGSEVAVLTASINDAGTSGYLTLPSPAGGASYLYATQGNMNVRCKAASSIYLGDDTNQLYVQVQNGQMAARKFVATGSAPAVVSAAGSTSVGVVGRDCSHTLTLTTAAGLAAGTVALLVNFNVSWALAPGAVPRVALQARDLATAQAQPYVAATAAGQYSVAFANPPSSATAMTLDVIAIGSP